MKIGKVNYCYTKMLLVQVDGINLKLAFGQATLSVKSLLQTQVEDEDEDEDEDEVDDKMVMRKPYPILL